MKKSDKDSQNFEGPTIEDFDALSLSDDIEAVRRRWALVRERAGESLVYADAIADIALLLAHIDELEDRCIRAQAACELANIDLGDEVSRRVAAESRVARLEAVVEAVRAAKRDFGAPKDVALALAALDTETTEEGE